MKYKITKDLPDIVDNNIFPEPVGPSTPPNEYFPPAILVEACQTLDENGKPCAPANTRYIQSRKFKLYGIPDLPKIRSSSNIEKVPTITVTNTATFEYLNSNPNIRQANNVNCNFFNSDDKIVGTSVATESIKTQELTTDSVNAIIGIIDDLNGIKLSYQNVQIQNIDNHEISATIARFNDYIRVDDYISAKILEFDTLKRDDSYETDILNTKTFRTGCENYSVGIDIYDDISCYNSGTIVGIKGTGEISSQLFSTDYITNEENIIGSIYLNDRALLNNRISENEEFYRQWLPVTSIGKTRLKVYPTNDSISKFDRLEVVPNSNGLVQKHNQNSTNKIIGIALNGQEEDMVDAIVLFNV